MLRPTTVRTSLLFMLLLGALAWLWWPRDGAPLVPAKTAPVAEAVNANADEARATSGPTAPRIDAARGDEEASRTDLATAASLPNLHGTVRTVAGVPVADAELTFTPADAGEPLATRSRADGRYALAVPLGVLGTLGVATGDFAYAARSNVGGGMQVDIVVQPAATLRGRVVRQRDGAPVVDATVKGRQRLPDGERGALPLFSVRTDADGSFVVERLEPGRVHVTVIANAPLCVHDEDVDLRPAATAQLAIALRDGEVVRGRVLDAATRRPLGSARVTDRRYAVACGADGAFEFAGLGGGRLLWAQCEGYGEREFAVRPAGKPGLLGDVEVLLVPAAALRGRVVDERGAPLAGVRALVVGSDSDGPFEDQRLWRDGTMSGDDGTFALHGLRSDLALCLQLRAAGCGMRVLDLGVLRPGELALGDLALRRGGSVRGRVHDEQGRGIAQWEVVLVGDDDERFARVPRPGEPGPRLVDSYVAERTTRTADDGAFVFADVAPGNYRVRCQQLDSHVPEQRACRVQGTDATAVDVELVRGLAVRGAVRCSDGGELPTVMVSIDPEDGQRTEADVEMARDGTFAARGLLPGNYRVSLYAYALPRDRERGRSFRRASAQHVPAGGAAVAIELPVLLPIRVQVVDGAGRPAADVRVVVRDGSDVLAVASTDADGRATAAGLAGRTTRVTLHRPHANQEPSEAPELGTADLLPGGPEVQIGLR